MNPSIAAHQALPAVGLRGLALAGYPPRRYTAYQEVEPIKEHTNQQGEDDETHNEQ
jgi:hypothetical protein